MEARISYNAGPAFGLVYRRYQDTQSSYVRIEARDHHEAVLFLGQYLKTKHFVVLSIRNA
jgi:hypothetical protein